MILNEWRTSKIITEEYAKDNYRIIYNLDCSKENCVIFFTSHSFYPNNTENEIEDYLVVKDRYEWVSISQNAVLRNYAKKFIFVRDVYKQWYAKGINENINSVQKLAEFLLCETKGLNVTTCGSSAGGYAAVLFGHLIGAEKSLNFCGQFSPELTSDDVQMFLESYQDVTENNSYRDISTLLKSSKTPVFYYYSAKSKMDIIQHEHVKKVVGEDCPLFFVTGINSSVHGMPVTPESAIHLISASVDLCVDLYQSCAGKNISKFAFLAKTNGVRTAIYILYRSLCKRLKLVK